ncbi:protein of unknown function [Serratia sp. Tan611]|nr:protein of unknown function [Serratia sp. Tan611]
MNERAGEALLSPRRRGYTRMPERFFDYRSKKPRAVDAVSAVTSRGVWPAFPQLCA